MRGQGRKRHDYLNLPFSFKSAPEENPTCSLVHLEILRNSTPFSPRFKVNICFFVGLFSPFGSSPEGHLSTHHSEAGTCCSAEAGCIKWEWSLSLVYLGFCLHMVCLTSVELVLGESTLDVKSQCLRESVGW